MRFVTRFLMVCMCCLPLLTGCGGEKQSEPQTLPPDAPAPEIKTETGKTQGAATLPPPPPRNK